LVLWFALFSIAAPAITCAAAADRTPCCPSEGTPPCGECPDPATAGVSDIHCVTSAAAVVQTVASSEQDGRLAQPDLDAVVAIPAQPGAALQLARPRVPDDRAHPPDLHDPPPYLLTGRLRL
jgi:hypothetical protein